jgi:uncharacterized membrane protein YhaH (DUF805 family)
MAKPDAEVKPPIPCDQENGYLWILFIILWFYSMFFILLPRIHDVGMKWWWILLIYFPPVYILLGIILLFRAPNYRLGESVQTSN